MAELRASDLYIWVTWLTKLLVGKNSYVVRFRAPRVLAPNGGCP